ncbi:MAG: DUF2288 domain-containing protein [Gammaproteobacteria bacterium]|nr:MAG: DUF2288 domain-containing protein [Gammaproteobacteria bacterium]
MSEADDFFQQQEADERNKIIRETAPIAWEALLPHFARGDVVAVATGLDLVAVAEAISRDESAQVKDWLDSGQIGKVSDAQAQDWLARQVTVWAVVIKPWVLVQERLPERA